MQTWKLSHWRTFTMVCCGAEVQIAKMVNEMYLPRIAKQSRKKKKTKIQMCRCFDLSIGSFFYAGGEFSVWFCNRKCPQQKTILFHRLLRPHTVFAVFFSILHCEYSHIFRAKKKVFFFSVENSFISYAAARNCRKSRWWWKKQWWGAQVGFIWKETTETKNHKSFCFALRILLTARTANKKKHSFLC